jgi:uncharacterized lipoprotein YajG
MRVSDSRAKMTSLLRSGAALASTLLLGACAQTPSAVPSPSASPSPSVAAIQRTTDGGAHWGPIRTPGTF